MGFFSGKISNEKNWKEPFFYLWNVDRVKVVFNCNYNNRNTKELFGEARKRADKIISLPPSRFNLRTLITEDNLKRVGIFRKEVGSIIPFQRFRKGIPIKGSKDCDSDDEEEAENVESSHVEEDASSQPGMDGLPSGWGLEMGVAPSVQIGKNPRTRPQKKDTKKKQTERKRSQVIIDLEKNKEKKRKEIPEAVDPLEGASYKKNKSSSFSLVSAALSPLAIPYVTDEDIMKWRNRNPSAENEAIIKASSEILISALHRQSVLQKEETRLEALEKDRGRLSKKVEDRDRVIDKLQKDLNQQKSFYESNLKTQEEVSYELNSAINTLKDEKCELLEQVAELKRDQQDGWVKEKKKIEGASFMKGFRNYASGFLAQDPDYDFSKFGDETVQWITKFKIDEAAEIKAKRVFLGLEKASPVLDEEEEDASSDGASPEKEQEKMPQNQRDDNPKVGDDVENAPSPIPDQAQDAS